MSHPSQEPHSRQTFLRQACLPDSHALEHLSVGVEGQHSGAAHAGTVQQAQRQALHEGQRRGLGGAVIDGAGDGRLRQDGVDADHVAVLQLQHPRQEGLRRLRGPEGRVNERRNHGWKMREGVSAPTHWVYWCRTLDFKLSENETTIVATALMFQELKQNLKEPLK